MRRKGFESLLCEAVRLYAEGNKRRTRLMLQAALCQLSVRRQALPYWVKVGCEVQWVGEGPHNVYKVIDVVRKHTGGGWYFRGERVLRDGSKEVMSFHQESGPRYWKQYITKLEGEKS